ncbi:hypothetical protein [Kineosporia sp. R_H_3]|uniref:hypothetical protein n=1 Tax=Kineosporia sp. R_H_3 TaxID=1961848 RepID=UPI000B4B7B94|nr:hypothetical protein [Kineosporia sp. R_H_3]
MTTVLDLNGGVVGSDVSLRSPHASRETIRGTLRALSFRTVEGQDQPVVHLQIETMGGIARITVPADTLVDVPW